MSNTIAASDLNRLARLSAAVVHGIDFPELANPGEAQTRLIGEVDRLDDIYCNDALLFDLRAAVCSRPMQKQAVYSLTHRIVKQARGRVNSHRPLAEDVPVIASRGLNRAGVNALTLYS